MNTNESFAMTVAKVITINAAASAAVTGGMLASLVAVALIAQKFQKKS